MLALLLALSLGADGTPQASAQPRPDFAQAARQRHAELIRRLVRRGDPAAVNYVIRELEGGLPPLSLQAFLQEARLHPQQGYVESLRGLTRYRRVHVRAQALVALAAHGANEADWATLAALDDPVLEVRLLGLDLVREYTTPRLEEAAMALMARDPEIASLVRARRRAVTSS